MRIAVIGLGAIGSQTLLHLSRLPNIHATGFDRLSPGHGFGASGGENRLFSTVGYGYPNHGDLVAYSLRVWNDLERVSGRQIVKQDGYLAVYDENLESGHLFVDAAKSSDSEARVLGRTQLAEEFGFQRYYKGDVGVFDPHGGMTRTDAAIFEATRAAELAGAQVQRNTFISGIEPHANGIRISSDQKSWDYDLAVVTTGPWARELLPQMQKHVHVHRPTSAWFLPKLAKTMHGLPALVREGTQQFYAAPTFDGASLKVGYGGPRQQELTHFPAPRDTLVDPNDLGEFPTILGEYLIGFDSTPFRVAHFFEGYTDSSRPVLQHVSDRIVAGVGFSGLGFKHSPAFGRLLAETAAGIEPASWLQPLRDEIPLLTV